MSSSMMLKAQKTDAIVGVWLNEEGDAQIRVYKKTNDKYYGKIVWLEEPNNTDGSPKVDDENPDEKLRSRPTMGLEILKSFKFDEDDKKWENGTIYDPKSGNTYKAYMWFEDGDMTKLQLRGYIGFSLIGRTSEWTREKEIRK